MATEKYDKIGRGGIVKEGIFVRFPELIPACTDEIFWSSENHSRLLIVAESNYFEDEAESVYKSVFKNPEAWYQGEDRQHLIPTTGKEPEEYKVKVSNWKAKYPPFDRLRDSMNAVSNGIHCERIFDEAMFYNYFLRPATVKVVRGKKNLTFKKDCAQIDRDVAGIALCGIIETAKPDIVIFISKYAYDEFRNYIKACGNKNSFRDFGNCFELTGEINVRIEFVNHPSHPAGWWNYKTGNGKQKFERLLREYWIKK
ncbi:MAG: hypothetical protein J6Y37_07665 [Paludibacteraceae bacterium]|nr:hypothetical protein [Paludibacteraceae bacterium]